MVQATWTKVSTDQAVDRSSQTLSVVGETAYIFGGELMPRQPVDADVFAVQLQSGHETSSIASIKATSFTVPQPRVGAASTVLNGNIFIFSGRGGEAMAPLEEDGTFWVFNTDRKTWSQIGPSDSKLPYPAGRSYHSMTNDGKDTIYLHAGCPESGRLHDLWSFNFIEHRWEKHEPAPGSGRGGTSIAVAGRKVYRMNGFDGKTEQGGTLNIFDPHTNTWSTINYTPDGVSGPTARSVCCLLSIMVADRPCLVTMFGESDPSNLGHQRAGKMLGDVWLFDISSEAWSRVDVKSIGDGPAPRGWFDADVLLSPAGPGIVVHGGLAESNERLGDMWVLRF